jgi:hypothetical protein
LVDRAKDQGALRLDFAGTEAIFIQVALTDVMDSRSHRSEVVPLLLTIFPGFGVDRPPIQRSRTAPPPISTRLELVRRLRNVDWVSFLHLPVAIARHAAHAVVRTSKHRFDCAY